MFAKKKDSWSYLQQLFSIQNNSGFYQSNKKDQRDMSRKAFAFNFFKKSLHWPIN